MDLEQLKLIIETLSAAGEGAYSVLLFYIIKDYAQIFLFFIGFMAVVCVVYKLICKTIVAVSLHEEIKKVFGDVFDDRYINKNRMKYLLDILRSHKEEIERKFNKM